MSEQSDLDSVRGEEELAEIKLKELRNKKSKFCRWRKDKDNEWNVYTTTCGKDFVLDEGMPKENHIIFCPFCGGKLK